MSWSSCLFLKFCAYLYREALEKNLNKRALEKKGQADILIHKQAQKDRELKTLKKMELQLNTIFGALEQDKSQHKRLKLEVCMNALTIRILNFLLRNLPVKSFDGSQKGEKEKTGVLHT